jgi:hypothetical protein
LKAFRVDFEYTDRAFLHIVAEDQDAAGTGALQMLKTVNKPVITSITEVDEEVEDTENLSASVKPTTLN